MHIPIDIHSRAVRALVLLALALVGALATQAAVADAATVWRYTIPEGTYIGYQSDPGDHDDLAITPHADGVVFEDATVEVSTNDPDCVELTPTKVRCNDDDIAGVVVGAGNGVNKVATTVDHPTEIWGGDGTSNDFWATAGPVMLTGGAGADTLAGGPGDDTINGQGGEDEINGFLGDDGLHGGEGTDRIYALPGADGRDLIDGGQGVDTVTYENRTTAVRVSLNAQYDDGMPAGDLFPGEQDNVTAIENVRGGNANDTLVGSPLPDVLAGGEGHDSIEGRDGSDILTGMAGADSVDGGHGLDTVAGGGGSQDPGDLGDDLVGGTGDDTLVGGDGNDLMHADQGADLITGGEGLDTVSYSTYTIPVTVDPDNVTYDDGAEGEGDRVTPTVENVIGGAGADTLAGNAAANEIRGGDGADQIDGLAGADALFGEGDDDTVRSQDGAVDSVDCGAGTDTAIVDAGDARTGCELPAPPGGGSGQSGDTQPHGDPPSTTGPVIRIRPGRLRLTSRGTARFRLACPAEAAQRCLGRLELRRRASSTTRTVGSRRFTLAAGATGTVKVRIAPAVRRSIGRRGVRITAVAVARDALSADRRTRRKVRLLPTAL